MKISQTKLDNIKACANDHGVISAAAMDQRGSLQKAIAASGRDVTDDDLRAFKKSVTQVLTPHASAILLDPTWGLEAAAARSDNAGLLLAYEESGYDNTTSGRLPSLIDGYSVQRIAEAGGNAIKILLYINPFDKEEINEQKYAFTERVGAECEAVGLPLFLEPITYDDNITDSFEFAKAKPKYVMAAMEELSKDRYGIDVLKLEFPLIAKHTGGLKASEGNEIAYSREEATDYLNQMGDMATKPYIFLSAGVDMPVFLESLELAAASGVRYNGVLCGRATWKGGIPVYGESGADALTDWLGGEGVDNINALNAVLDSSANPWYDVYGGMDKIEVTA
ncbi:MAG: tagatose 1,6-diphosphate aldolase [Deinococcota bacterium]